MRLAESASLIRSKNAGPFMLTFDVMFSTASAYEQVKRSADGGWQVEDRRDGVPGARFVIELPVAP